MYRKQADSSICGVLSDYDLALLLTAGTVRPTSMQRTGTKPYMAIDLLRKSPPTHMYRHDLESLFYVIVVLTSRYHDGRGVVDPPFQTWFDLGSDDLAKEKSSFLSSTPTQPTPNFQTISNWVLKMKLMFLKGYNAKSEASAAAAADAAAAMAEASAVTAAAEAIAQFDDHTLGGQVDFKKFSEIVLEDSKKTPSFNPNDGQA